MIDCIKYFRKIHQYSYSIYVSFIKKHKLPFFNQINQSRLCTKAFLYPHSKGERYWLIQQIIFFCIRVSNLLETVGKMLTGLQFLAIWGLSFLKQVLHLRFEDPLKKSLVVQPLRDISAYIFLKSIKLHTLLFSVLFYAIYSQHFAAFYRIKIVLVFEFLDTLISIQIFSLLVFLISYSRKTHDYPLRIWGTFSNSL